MFITGSELGGKPIFWQGTHHKIKFEVWLYSHLKDSYALKAKFFWHVEILRKGSNLGSKPVFNGYMNFNGCL